MSADTDVQDLSNFQRFPVIYGAKAQFKMGSKESAEAGAVAKLQFSINNNPHEITGLRIKNVYDVPAEFLELVPPDGMAYLERLDEEQTITMRMAQQNVVVDETLQQLVCGTGVHWHPFELPYPFRGGNNITVDVNRLTSYALPGSDPLVMIDAVNVQAAIVGWMYVGPGGVLPGPGSSEFSEFLNRTGQ